MFKQLRLQNFKSWQDTGNITLSPITGFFGTNSSGKSAILQFLLMLKQTMESSDRRQVLHTGDEKTYVNLGTLYDIAYNHKIPSEITFSLKWNFPTPLRISDPESPKEELFCLNYLEFSSKIKLIKERIFVDNFCYKFLSNSQNISFLFTSILIEKFTTELERYFIRNYELKPDGYKLKKSESTSSAFSSPIKNYGFPEQASVAFQNASFLSDFT